MANDSGTREYCLRDYYLSMAKLADVAERYSDMVEYMTLLMCCEHGVVLNPEELEMLWMAYKNFTNCQWSSLCATIVSQASELDTHRPTIIRDYRYRLESELNSILVLLNSHLIPSFVNYWVSRIQYLKMKGDYHLHFARMIRGYEASQAAIAAYFAYKEA
ncbi:hypothetical protein AMTR_s00008p00038760 [Amborella trichopoda]|uniref:14-3-3 domain-containing protein n=1 Tax=Amborella trichopoda TaxID=13333 RepID=W1NHK3_AMBTC|nr:hypothetical protein AMTR_s00008p00038760 [Amborella trichopoda]